MTEVAAVVPALEAAEEKRRLVIVGHHAFAVRAIRLAIEKADDSFAIVGVLDGRDSIRHSLAPLQADVVLIDDMARTEHALSRIAEAAEAAPDARLLLLSIQMAPAWLHAAFTSGAHAVVSKSVPPDGLAAVLTEIVRGHVALRPEELSLTTRPEGCPLTARELDVLRLVAQGYSNGRAASTLWVTEQTVKFHLSNIYRKLGVRNRTEASRYLLAMVSPGSYAAAGA